MWLQLFLFISIHELQRKSRKQNTWINLFFFVHTLIFNRLLESNRSAAMKQTLVAAAAEDRRIINLFAWTPFSDARNTFISPSLMPSSCELGENGATGYVCYYTIHPPTSAQWNIFTIFYTTCKYGCLQQTNFLPLSILEVLNMRAFRNNSSIRCSKYICFSFADAIELWAGGKWSHGICGPLYHPSAH